MMSSRLRGLDIEQIIEETPVAELIDELIVRPSEEQGVFIDQGLPIPESYDVDTIQALVQDPFHIWVYWEVRDVTAEKVNTIFPVQIAQTFKPVLKVTELTLGHTAMIDIAWRGNYWLSVFPDRRYRIEVGLYSPERGYIRLLEADEIRTPRGTISYNIAEDEYKVSGDEFTQVLQASGFASFTEIIGPERVLAKLPEEVAEVVSTAASGMELSDEQFANLPPRIRQLMLELRNRGEGGLASLALLHLLPEYLRETVEEDFSVEDTLHPVHLSPRFIVGASEQMQIPRRWAPPKKLRPTSPTK
ncbi:MAG: DUF4912 domain-containing protein [Acidobacteriota bacterium]|nr:DUF4912 domain-containing protein [Blastocatellia bacterium]MDW8412397.1 DUF4912 domain-containing protein [Acidobacteriota bacterium]